MQEKACTQCGKMKPLDEFHRFQNARDGHRSECKACANQRQRDNYDKKKRRPKRLMQAVCAYAECGEPFEYERSSGPERMYHTERCKYLAGEAHKKAGAAKTVRACACGSTDVRPAGVPVCPNCRKDPRSDERTKARERRRILRLYNITQEQYDAMLAAQGGKCGNRRCTRTEPGGQGTWKIDHDHACCPGKGSCGRCVRGLLCNNCNQSLGFAGDSIGTLEGLIEYRKRTSQPALFRAA